MQAYIFGFAIDELMLRETFQTWALIGNGQYFDARNAEELATGLFQAVDTPFMMFGEDGNVIAKGAAKVTADQLGLVSLEEDCGLTPGLRTGESFPACAVAHVIRMALRPEDPPVCIENLYTGVLF